MAKKISIGAPLQLAEKIFKIEQEIQAFMEPIKALEEKKDKLRTEMLEALKANRMEQLKTERGVTFSRVSRASLVVTDPDKAFDWALQNHCVKIDTTKAASSLKGKGALPEGFEENYTESLRVEGLSKALDGNV